jgi:hypothetical protein
VTDLDLSSAVAVGAVDIELNALGGGRFEVVAGGRRYVVETTEQQWDSLCAAVTAIVPRLARTAPVREQLDAAELRAIRPYLKQLAAFGVLLFPEVEIATPAQLRLYSFLARRADSPDRAYAAIRSRQVAVSGPAVLAGPLRDALAAQGLAVADHAASPALSVVVSLGDRDALASANQRHCGAGLPWLPILLTARQVRLGPWTIPGESACLRCLPAEGGAPERTTPGCWLTTQAGMVGWLAGLVAHNTLRAFLPMAAEHPWGEVVTIDALTCQQSAHRMWRDPYCPVCAARAPAAAAWVEV